MGKAASPQGRGVWAWTSSQEGCPALRRKQTLHPAHTFSKRNSDVSRSCLGGAGLDTACPTRAQLICRKDWGSF